MIGILEMYQNICVDNILYFYIPNIQVQNAHISIRNV